MKDTLREAALEYHRVPNAGKIAIVPTKAMATQRDLALAYSPGVAAPCEEIEKDPLKALDYTSRGNLVAVISNGTAVLGLGDIGALAAKPVMEGKAVLFKKFANIDSIDIEIDEKNPDKLIEIIASLEPSFGGINLEDIKAPECFEIERRLRERMKIPVFHDDQHGTAIIVGAALTNWLHISKRKITDIKLVTSGAGAAALACLNILVSLGLPKDNIIVTDRQGVVYKGRTEGMDPDKAQYAVETNARSLGDAIEDADVFLGLSAAGVLTKDMVRKMAKAPLILALANPTPEILPEEAREAKPDAVICTGRSDYNNQVNNVLCFPFIFRGALDVGATAINEEMKLACVHAIANLARKEVSAEVAAVYGGEQLSFGLDYMIPKPFDPRLIVELPMAVAKVAMETGVATRPITDWNAYREKLQSYTYRTSMAMRPLFARAKTNPKRVVYCEGEEERVLRAIQVVVDDGLAHPVLIGRRSVVETRIKRLHLRIEEGKDFELIDPESDPRYRDYWTRYHQIMERRGVTPAVARTTLRTNASVIGALMVERGYADAMICGTIGVYRDHLKTITDIIGLQPGVETAAALSLLIMNKGSYFICDTHVNPDPSIAQISEMTLMAAEAVQRFGIKPKIALLSHSNFGTHNNESAFKMRAALSDLRQRAPELEIDGEMHADAALSQSIRQEIMPNSTLHGEANLFVMPNVDAANIAFNMMKVLGDAIAIGPMLLGVERPAHIVSTSITPRGIVNVTAVATVEAQIYEAEHKQETIRQTALNV
ncbi:MAG: NADP-dependent malic enzyme [Micavibrio aeruginosavorus]|uniref:NADP-dependent malic enzyme n=1 Tax=Micavibrio aeruginosavorus TaxID=349221 RepID=A0A7T5R418_9BACT|nr:MAG: NADP-dependent malic enzyme [Micavibrio aeruginosavorus]